MKTVLPANLLSNSQSNLQSNLSSDPKDRNVGIVKAGLASGVAKIPLQATSCALLYGMSKLSKLSKEDAVQLNEAANEALSLTGLKEKGIQILRADDIGFNLKDLFSRDKFAEYRTKITNLSSDDLKIIETVSNNIKESKFFKKFHRFFPKEFVDEYAKESAIQNIFTQVKMGLNACYAPSIKSVVIPKNSLKTSIFHEIGHAMNDVGGGMFLKMLQKAKPVSVYLPGIILAVSIINKRKATDKKIENDSNDLVKNKIQNGFDFIKKNAGKLTALSMLPMILEEGIASLRGQKVAKAFVNSGKLTKNVFKKICLTNLCGFSSYILNTIFAVLAVKLAIKIKDSIQEKYENKFIQN